MNDCRRILEHSIGEPLPRLHPVPASAISMVMQTMQILVPIWDSPRKSYDMPSTTLPALAEDELDDILYFSRIGDLKEVKGAIENSAKQANVSLHDILLAAVDESSGNGPLHMASANGHTGLSNCPDQRFSWA